MPEMINDVQHPKDLARLVFRAPIWMQTSISFERIGEDDGL
jgi:hypothetical protein